MLLFFLIKNSFVFLLTKKQKDRKVKVEQSEQAKIQPACGSLHEDRTGRQQRHYIETLSSN